MSKLEHCLENAIIAVEEGKDYDQWRYEEIPRHNATPFNRDWAILTDGYVKLAEYEDVEELMEQSQPKPLQWQRALMKNFLRKE